MAPSSAFSMDCDSHLARRGSIALFCFLVLMRPDVRCGKPKVMVGSSLLVGHGYVSEDFSILLRL